MNRLKVALLVTGLMLIWSTAGDAQRAGVQPNSGAAFALEALGGSVGSLVGMGIVALATECGVDDLACGISRTVVGGAIGAAGAAIATVLTARQTGSSRSGAGALIGSILGTGVGLGVHYLLNRESDRNLGELVTIPIFMLSQGVFAALGSRVGGRSSGRAE